jgi:two-component system cell cycle sensor histidine kinase/response regulator CckA
MGTQSTILLADDEPMLRNLIRTAFERDEYSVLVAANGSEALELSRAHDGVIDLLVTDVHMPLMDGISLYRQISRERRHTRVLFISGSGHKLKMPSGLPFLSKPFEIKTLLSKIREILSGEPSSAPDDPDVVLIVDNDENRQNRTRQTS